MAQKRMFDKLITNSDDFLELPDSSQVLYFHLSMNADDDGFVNNCKSIMKMTGTKEDDLKILILKSFIIPFENGVIVIKHWRINNYLRNDRYKQTNYVKELDMLNITDFGEYVLKQSNIDVGIPMVYPDKNRIEENSINNIYNQNFEQLWSIYPKKQGKANALKSFTKAIKKGVSFETIENGLNRYIEYINNNHISPQYIKQGSTWFNQECWNDEYTNVQQKSNYQRNKEFLERMLQEDE